MSGDLLSFNPPPMSVSVPEAVEWHMIFDHELDQLSRFEVGIVGSIGLVFLGTVLGLAPSLAATLAKTNQPMTSGDIACVAVFFGCLVGALICLLLGGLHLWRNKGLAGNIRKRTRHGLISSRANEENVGLVA